ncbi:MAG TPA: M20/M25/M40 family metallo-hydrolase [Pyrinomonadaceae bacterium]|jgi:Zn-dependent M28 family amino/carboxypeptidase|nr:M20/M25/M40 family metallo-hydrolase [Pyrinomonadaceae bacterium]
MTKRVSRIALLSLLCLLLAVPVSAQRNAPIKEQNIRAELGFLASDAMQGRGSSTNYERIAAEYIGSQFRQFGLDPGGDTDNAGNKSYVQRIPLNSGVVPSGEQRATWNAIGVLKGLRSDEVIMLSAHLDHLGVNESLTGDKIFNGADDDASGCIAVLELARVLAAGRRPRRTIYFVCFGSEERGGYGSRHFIDNSPVPLPQIVADLTFEMLGRPDSKVPPGTLWLTGFERSTLGPELARQGAALVADPHPEQNFFRRSDNYSLALRGVVAHTVSSFGLHADYHRVSDEIDKIDFPFMTRSLNSLVRPVQWLANSTFRPAWLPGQAPTR